MAILAVLARVTRAVAERRACGSVDDDIPDRDETGQGKQGPEDHSAHDRLQGGIGTDQCPPAKIGVSRRKSKRVQLIGNSLCPEPAEALVRANDPDGIEERVA